MAPPGIDLSDPGLLLRPDLIDDPRRFHDALRREAPVWQIPGQDTFLVSDPGLVREAVRRTDDFSSNIVHVLHDDGHGCPVPHLIAPYRDPIHVLATADPPDHTRHRAAVQLHLGPGAVAAFEPAVGRIVDDHLVPLLAARRVDVVDGFSDPVPAHTICEVLGLPASDAGRVISLTLAVGALLDGVADAEGIARAGDAAMELGLFTHGRLQEALARPEAERTGILGVLAGALERGELTETEVLSMLTVFVSAGSETTASLLSTAIETLARDPGRQRRLRAEPALIPDFVEDVLRTDGPFQFHYRYPPADTELGGVAIPAGSRVLLMWAAANRPTPDTDGGADPGAGVPEGPHFAFGRGIHFCIGAPLARLEARVALERLLAGTSSIVLDPAHPPTRRPSIFIRRHETLPVVVEPA
jgi:cytochrome P450